MAGDWIKMRKSLLGDPRVVRIMSALHADRFRTIGGLFSAWCLLDEQTTDGRLSGYTTTIFDEVVGVVGMAAAMESVGWLEIGVDFVAAPRFFEHNGQTAKRRSQDSVRKMSARDADKTRTNKRTECGPEKRREEKEKSKRNTKKENTSDPTTDGHVYDSGFEEFWQSFPKIRRTKKRDAAARWKVAIKLVAVAELTAKAKEYAASPNGKSRFAVMPSTFLVAGMWDDDPEAWKSTEQLATRKLKLI